MINTAVILAGGFGTRLRPLTDTVPKPLLPVNGKPTLLHIIENLKRNGVTPDSDKLFKLMYSTRGALESVLSREIRN